MSDCKYFEPIIEEVWGGDAYGNYVAIDCELICVTCHYNGQHEIEQEKDCVNCSYYEKIEHKEYQIEELPF